MAIPAPPAAVFQTDAAVVVGSYAAPNSMPVPGTITSEVPLGPTSIPALQPNSYVLLRISGTLQAERNPYLGGSAGQGQIARSYSPVQSIESTGRGATNVWLRPSPSNLTRVSYFFRPAANGNDLVLMVRTGAQPTEVWAERERMPGAALFYFYCRPGKPYCTPDGPDWIKPDTGSIPLVRTWVEDYWIVSSHVVTATAVAEPLVVEGPTLVAPGATAAFTARPWEDLRLRYPHGQPGDVRWMWYPTDTIGTTPAAHLAQAVCPSQPTCQFEPKVSGRLRVSSYVEGAQVETDKIVRVQQQPTLALACTPGSVTRGGDVTCSARVTPAMEMIVTERSARGPGFSFSESRSDVIAPGDSVTWTGKAVAPTQVRLTVRVTVAGQNKVLRQTANFAVTGRNWAPYQLVAPSPVTVGLRGQMTDYPSNGHLGNFGLNGLNPFSTPIDSVSSGPNTGLLYFVDRPPFIGAGSSIFIHPGLYPPTGSGTWGHTGAQQWYNDQNGAPSGTCSQSDVSLLKTEVERHEGVTQASNSHYGVANQQFLAHRPERTLEALYLFRVPQARLQTRAYQLYEQFIRGPAHTAQSAFDNVDYPLILSKFSCQFDFNKANH